MGGRSKTSSTSSSNQVIDTRNVGLEGTEGVAVAGGGDVEVNLSTSDMGAIQGAFQFSEGFASDAFDFASSSQIQAGELAERSLENSQAALATVATGGQSDLSRIDQKTLAMIAAALTVVLVVPKLFTRKA